eukprot:2315716-Amphidinium_carterae.1
MRSMRAISFKTPNKRLVFRVRRNGALNAISSRVLQTRFPEQPMQHCRSKTDLWFCQIGFLSVTLGTWSWGFCTPQL